MPTLEEVGKSTVGQLGLLTFRGVLVILLSLLAWLGNQVYQKVESSADKLTVERTAADLKATVDRSNTSLWSAISTTTKAQNELTNNLSILAEQMKAHNTADEIVDRNVADHEQRL